MVAGHPAAQRFTKLLGRGLDPPIGKIGQPFGIALAGNQRLDHRATGKPDDVRDDRVELDVGILQRLLKVLDMAASFANQLLAGAQQAAQFLGLGGTKLPRIRPWAIRSASQVASLTSVLCPRTFLTCPAFASTNAKSPSLKTCQTGLQ